MDCIILNGGTELMFSVALRLDNPLCIMKYRNYRYDISSFKEFTAEKAMNIKIFFPHTRDELVHYLCDFHLIATPPSSLLIDFSSISQDISELLALSVSVKPFLHGQRTVIFFHKTSSSDEKIHNYYSRFLKGIMIVEKERVFQLLFKNRAVCRLELFSSLLNECYLDVNTTRPNN